MTAADRKRIHEAVAEAERGTTARIGVRFVADESVDAFERAKAEFEAIGMHRHETRNAALILVAPKAKRFAVIGDEQLHARVGDAFWTDTVAAMQPHFREGSIGDAVVLGLHRLGAEMKRHFPS
ncbi:MAG: DUF5130 family protein [bacterium]|nr:DUF5130 family protein [bacterium]